MPLTERKKPQADLRKSYFINMQVGIIITLIVLIVIVNVNLNFGSDHDFTEREQRIIQMEDIIRTEQVEVPPPPARPRSPEPVPDSEILEDDVFDFGFDDGDAISELPPPPPPQDEEEEEEYRIFEVVEDQPYPHGGMQSIYDNLQYPSLARRAGIEGMVVIQFVVDENGNVSEPVILQDIGGGTGQAAVDAILKTSWEPGRQRGRAVPVRFQVPVRFVLQNH